MVGSRGRPRQCRAVRTFLCGHLCARQLGGHADRGREPCAAAVGGVKHLVPAARHAGRRGGAQDAPEIPDRGQCVSRPGAAPVRALNDRVATGDKTLPDQLVESIQPRWLGLRGVVLVDHCAAVGESSGTRWRLTRTDCGSTWSSAFLLRTHLLYARAVLAEEQEAEWYYLSALAEDLSRWRLARAKIEQAYGDWLLRQERYADAQEYLLSALRSFRDIGAVPWADQARRSLRTAGRDPEVQPATGSEDAANIWDADLPD
jgi:hypothetical protein